MLQRFYTELSSTLYAAKVLHRTIQYIVCCKGYEQTTQWLATHTTLIRRGAGGGGRSSTTVEVEVDTTMGEVITRFKVHLADESSGVFHERLMASEARTHDKFRTNLLLCLQCLRLIDCGYEIPVRLRMRITQDRISERVEHGCRDRTTHELNISRHLGVRK